MKIVKIGLGVFVGIPLLIVLIAIVFILTIDPNKFKPDIQAALQKQGIASEFNGDISWSFFPKLGLQLEQLKLKTPSDAPLLDIGQLLASVEVMPLFKKQVVVDAIILKDTGLHYIVAESGHANWDTVTQQGEAAEATPAQSPEEPTSSAGGSFNLRQIDIDNLNIHYADAGSGSKASIEGAYLKSTNVNTDGKAFPIELGASIELDGLPKTVLSISGDITVDLKATLLKIVAGQLKAEPGSASIVSHLDIELNWSQLVGQGRWRLDNTQIQPIFKSMGIPAPVTQNKNALQSMSASTDFAFSANNAKISNTKLALDQTLITGETNVKQFAPLNVTSHWQGNQINLDDYLPPPSEEEKTETAEPEKTASPLPLDFIRDTELADIRFSMDKITIMQLDIAKLSNTITVKDDILKQTFSTNIAGGDMKGESKLDANEPEAKLTFSFTANQVNSGYFATKLADFDKVDGPINAIIEGKSRGATDLALTDNLAFTAKVQSEQVVVTPFNLEKQFCDALAMIERKEAPAYDWPQKTVMSPLETLVTYENKTLTVNKLGASVSKLETSATGKFEVESGQFEFPIELSLGNFAGELEGCLPIPKSWREASIPILCKGTVEGIDYKTCLPNTKKIGRLVEDRLKSKANEKIDAEKKRAEDKLKDKAKDKLIDKLGEDKAKEVEDKLKGLLRGL